MKNRPTTDYQVNKAIIKGIEKKRISLNNSGTQITYSLIMADEFGNSCETEHIFVQEYSIKPLLFKTSPIPELTVFGSLMKQIHIQNTSEIIGKEIYLYPDDSDFFLPVSFNPNLLETVHQISGQSSTPEVQNIPLSSQKGMYGIIRSINLTNLTAFDGSEKKCFRLEIDNKVGNTFICYDSWVAKIKLRLIGHYETRIPKYSPLGRLLEYNKLDSICDLLGKEIDAVKRKNSLVPITFDVNYSNSI